MENMNGWFVYQSIAVQQHENVAEVFKNLIIKKQPARILEIGTAYGGLTKILRDTLDELNMKDVIILSYDNYCKHYLNDVSGIDARNENIFSSTYQELDLEKSKEVIDFIQNNGVTIVLCDGGSKKDEFNLLAPYLKSGDIIMAHDYAPNKEYFEEKIKNKIWNWMEIQDSDIDESVNKNGLIPFMQDEFIEVVWVCKEKKYEL